MKKEVVGLATGCYDILHIGHVHFLKEAKKHCGKLLVGINSDRVVKEVKGQDRPINKQSYRKEVLETLKPVDEVFIFDSWLIKPIVEKIRPDILFIPEGSPGEKTISGVAKRYRAKLIKIPLHKCYLENVSTSGVLERILNKNDTKN